MDALSRWEASVRDAPIHPPSNVLAWEQQLRTVETEAFDEGASDNDMDDEPQGATQFLLEPQGGAGAAAPSPAPTRGPGITDSTMVRFRDANIDSTVTKPRQLGTKRRRSGVDSPDGDDDAMDAGAEGGGGAASAAAAAAAAPAAAPSSAPKSMISSGAKRSRTSAAAGPGGGGAVLGPNAPTAWQAAPAALPLPDAGDPFDLSQVPELSRIIAGMSSLVSFIIQRSPLPTTDNAREAEKANRLWASPPQSAAASGASRQDVLLFLSSMSDLCKYTNECSMIALILVMRLTSYDPAMMMRANTWRRTWLVALLIVQKFWDDRCLRNMDFTIAWRHILGPSVERITLAEINEMEADFLARIRYELYVPASNYAYCLLEVLQLVQTPGEGEGDGEGAPLSAQGTEASASPRSMDKSTPPASHSSK